MSIQSAAFSATGTSGTSLPSVAVIAYQDLIPFLYSIPQIVFTTPTPEKLFNVFTVTASGQPLSSGTVTIQPDGDFDLLEQADVIIIPGWYSPDAAPSQELGKALVRAHKRGAWVAGLCLGAYVLAYAGLLNGRKASTHWQAEADFKQRFPHVELNTNSLYVEDERVVTSAGIGAGVDCCLFLVRQFYGVKIANKIARIMVMPPYREGGQAQFIEQQEIAAPQDIRIKNVLTYVQEHLHEAHSLDTLAELACMSKRSFTRHFEKATGMSVGKWLISQRLRRACELLEATSLSVEEIAEEVGFNTSNSFRQHFRAYYRVSPRTWRRNFNSINDSKKP